MREIDFSYIELIKDEGPEFVKRFIGLFEDTCFRLIENMEQCVDQQKWDELKVQAHQLKPSFQMLGLSDLSAIENAPAETNKETIASIRAECRDAVKQLKNYLNQ